MERFHELNAMQLFHELISLLWLYEESTFTFHPSLASHLFSLISLFPLENPTELVFLIQHMFAVFPDLIGPESSRDVPSSIFSPFAAFPIFRVRDPRSVPISRGHNFSVPFDRRRTHRCFSILTHHPIVTNSNVMMHNPSLSRSVGKIDFEHRSVFVREVSAGQLLRLRLISQETSVIASELGISRRRCKRPAHYSQS